MVKFILVIYYSFVLPALDSWKWKRTKELKCKTFDPCIIHGECISWFCCERVFDISMKCYNILKTEHEDTGYLFKIFPAIDSWK
jgi:hypothetical protein